MVRVMDGSGTVATKPFQITVAAPPLAITTTSLPDGTRGVLYSQPITASGGSQAGYSWSISDGSLPPGLSLTPSGVPSATLSGTPISPGTYFFTVEVTDFGGASASRDFRVEIAAGQLEITTTSLPDGVLGYPYSRPIAAVGGSQAAYSWSISGGSLPPGLSLSLGGTPSATLSGTPSSAGTYSFTVNVTDSSGAVASQPLLLTVAASSLRITTTTLPAATRGTYYVQSITASGGTQFGYSWSTPGPLPPGLFLTATGTPSAFLHGTPSTQGYFVFPVTVRDSSGAIASKSVQITVRAPSIAPKMPETPGGLPEPPSSGIVDAP